MKTDLVIARITVLACTLLGVAAAQQFPRLQEENVAGQQVVLPDAVRDKVAVLVFGFTRASQNSTGAWVKHLRDDFGKTEGFALYQLPVLEEAPRLIRGMITSGMKKGVPEAERTNFVPVVHNEAELKKLVSYKEADDAYLVVLDRTGKIAYQTHGGPDASGYAELRNRLQNLLK
jgi:ATP synthase subunit 10